MGKNPLKTYAHAWAAAMAAPLAGAAAVAAPQKVFKNAFGEKTTRLLNYRTIAGAAGAAAVGAGALAGGFAAAPGVAAPGGTAAAGMSTGAGLATTPVVPAAEGLAIPATSSVLPAVPAAAPQVAGPTFLDYLTGYSAAGGLALSGAQALAGPPKAPKVPRLPPPPTYAADSAAAAERRRKQALASYGPLSTIKTTPTGLGGGKSSVGGY